jgi:hypothetical protein
LKSISGKRNRSIDLRHASGCTDSIARDWRRRGPLRRPGDTWPRWPARPSLPAHGGGTEYAAALSPVGHSQLPLLGRLGSGGRGECGEHNGGVPIHRHSPDMAGGERRQRERMWWQCGLGGEVEVQFLVPCELHGTLGQLLVVEGEADEAPLRLSTTAQLLRWMTMEEIDDPTT